jgi:hypothetical protein
MSRRRRSQDAGRSGGAAIGLVVGAVLVLAFVVLLGPAVVRVLESPHRTSTDDRYTVTDTATLAERVRAAGIDCRPIAAPWSSRDLGITESVRCEDGDVRLELAVHASRRALFEGIELVVDGLACLVSPETPVGGPVGGASSYHMVHDERWSIVLHDADTADRIARTLGAAHTSGTCAGSGRSMAQL